MRAGPEPEPATSQIPTCMKRIRAFSFIIIIIRKSIKLCIAFGLNDLNQIVVLFMISRCHNNNNGNNIWILIERATATCSFRIQINVAMCMWWLGLLNQSKMYSYPRNNCSHEINIYVWRAIHWQFLHN